MRGFNETQDWCKYISGRVVRELIEAWPEKRGQVLRESYGYNNYYKVAE